VPIVKTLADRVESYKAKTAPDRVGTRYGAVKELAVNRYIGGVGSIVAIREIVRNILESNGVPASAQGVYYAFAFKLASKGFSHSGKEFDDIVAGLKAWFTAKGADPAVLDKIASLFG